VPQRISLDEFHSDYWSVVMEIDGGIHFWESELTVGQLSYVVLLDKQLVSFMRFGMPSANSRSDGSSEPPSLRSGFGENAGSPIAFPFE
jgi:hypothetical protein